MRRALVSSTPDDGTLKLYEKSPAGIVPSLRPYRTRDDMSTWPRDLSVAAYVEERLKRGIYRAIGESHFGASDVPAPVVKRFAELAVQRQHHALVPHRRRHRRGDAQDVPGDEDPVGARRHVGLGPAGR